MMLNCILILMALNGISTAWTIKSIAEKKLCPKEKTPSSSGIFEWKIDNKIAVNYVISQPDICWKNDKIVVRQCNFTAGEWFPLQIQCEKFQSTNIKCPDDLIEMSVRGEYLCLKISNEKHPFDEHFCYGSNFIMGYNRNSIDNEISSFLLEKYNIKSFWLPMKRYEENKFNPIVIRLPGKQWNDLYSNADWKLSVNNPLLSDKHCVVGLVQKDIKNENKTEMKIEMTHCREAHFSVCVFKKKFIAKSGCPQDFGALSHKPNECYGITWDGQRFPDDYRMLQIKEYFKRINTLKLIFDKFDIEKDKYVEVEGTIQIANAKWALKPESNQMKIVSSEEKLHGLCVEYIESRKNVEMLLRMDLDFKALLLTVYNKYYIWTNNDVEKSINCFTNADYGELSRVDIKKIWENTSQTKSIFVLDVNDDDPGQYWCEAHTIFNFTHVSSTKVVASKKRNGHAFALQIQIPLEVIRNPLEFRPEQMKTLATFIKKEIKYVKRNHNYLNDLNIHNVRIMDTLYVHPKSIFLRCLCHITVSIKSSGVDTSNEQNIKEDNSVVDDYEVRHDTGVRMRARDLLISLMEHFQPAFAHTVRSTEFCFPENDWTLARIGQSTTKSKLCLQKNGLPITRRCLGDFIEGAYWEHLSFYDCIKVSEADLITKNLYNIDIQKIPIEQPEKAVKDVRKLLESNLYKIIPADLYYVAKIIRNSVKTILKSATSSSSFVTHFEPQVTTNISEITFDVVRIFNYLLKVNDRIIRPSSTLNSTNILLDTFENLIDHMSQREHFTLNINNISNQNVIQESLIDKNDKEIDIIEFTDVGVVVKSTTNFVIFYINPLVANVTGIALFRTELNSFEEHYDDGFLKGAFKNEYYRFILANQSIDELLNEPNILIGTFVPTSLWERLDEISMVSNNTSQREHPQPRVVIKIYANDKLFQETKTNTDKIVYGKVVSISIPGHGKDLPEVLPLILSISSVETNDDENFNDTELQKHYCSYWNYQRWASDGIMFLGRSDNNTVLCGCTHLTPFAYLIGGSYNLSIDSDIEVIITKTHKQALDIITLLGCSLSLFGIVGIFITACTFRSWRKKANSKVLLQFSTAIALQMILFCFVNTEENSLHLINNKIFSSCIAIGASLHYSVLVQFCWMVIIAYLQFKRYVQVFGNTRPKRFFIKSTILGWGVPLLPVACVLLFDKNSYIPHQNESANPLCYPSGYSFYLGIVLPITLVILANLVIFLIVIYNILQNPAGSIRHTEKNLALSQIRILVLLFFLLGFTWIFGLLNAMNSGLVFSYLFCLTATLQGFILFIYFIVMDPRTRRMWYGCLRKLFGFKPNFENSSSVKETTQTF
ncbi:uncharacterized protein ACRADG_002921 isoform 1-T8 [Cochliomyia hominivorax]